MRNWIEIVKVIKIARYITHASLNLSYSITQQKREDKTKKRERENIGY